MTSCKLAGRQLFVEEAGDPIGSVCQYSTATASRYDHGAAISEAHHPQGRHFEKTVNILVRLRSRKTVSTAYCEFLHTLKAVNFSVGHNAASFHQSPGLCLNINWNCCFVAAVLDLATWTWMQLQLIKSIYWPFFISSFKAFLFYVQMCSLELLGPRL